MKNIRVLVAGSEGLIGKHIVEMIDTNHNADGPYIVDTLDKARGDDLTNEKFVKEYFSDNAGCFDVIINTFAFNDHVSPGEKRGTLFDLPLESFKNCMDVNLTALFSVCREFARNNKGSIINFGASTGLVSARTDMYAGAHKHVGYSVSKAGVIHMTKILAVHLAPDVRVNCISPGGVESTQSEEFKQLYGSHTPLNRMCKLDELMPAIEMLLDPRNSYMTGANIIIDGGWTII